MYLSHAAFSRFLLMPRRYLLDPMQKRSIVSIETTILTAILLPIIFAPAEATSIPPWTMELETYAVTLHMNHETSILLIINASTPYGFTVNTDTDENIATANYEPGKQIDMTYYGVVNVTGNFMGNTIVVISVDAINEDGEKVKSIVSDSLSVTVTREQRLLDTMFTISVAVLVSLLYVNFGCAMDWKVCRTTLARPVGPTIGFLTQFTFMPLLSYCIGQLLFPEKPELQLGLFFTGISPSGGASNIWTVLLGGNLNLSVTMTTICTIAAFGTMPFWIFTLGRHIFETGDVVVPYRRITAFAVALIIPLAVGFYIQKKFPRVSKLLIRLMKPFSVILIIFIIIFGIVTNLFLFRLFSTEILIAGMGLPWLGFILGFLVATIFKQPYPDIKAIAIETGIQNTGVAIFLLKFSLQPPTDDLTTIVPVSAAIMTPIPLVLFYLGNMLYERRRICRNLSSLPPDTTSTSLPTQPATPPMTSLEPLNEASTEN